MPNRTDEEKENHANGIDYYAIKNFKIKKKKTS
jgi:hypothetical protein